MDTYIRIKNLKDKGYISSRILRSRACQSLIDESKLLLLLMLRIKFFLSTSPKMNGDINENQ